MNVSKSCSIIVYVVGLLLFALGGCSGCEEEVSGGPIDDAGIDADHDAADGDVASDADGDIGGGPDPDTGDAGDDDDVIDDDCPLSYQRECEGECVSVNTDIENCGDCGITCEGDEACVGGECTTECMGSLQLCDNRCVDYAIDSDHCGSCGSPCGEGLGCSDGECVEAADLGPGPEECSDIGPPIEIDVDDGEFDACTGEIAQSTFLWALCTCGDLTTQDHLLTDGFNSSSGPYQPGGLGAGVGVNGHFATESEAWIWGAVYVGPPSGVDFGDETEIHQQLHVGGDLWAGDYCQIYDDAYIAGDIDADDLEISGTLYSPAGADTGGASYGDLQEFDVTVAPPCPCDDESIIPIVDIVESAQSPNNDNQLIDLDEDLLVGDDAPQRVDLPCGEYYLSEIDVDGDVTIVAHGRVVLYIDGDIELGGELSLTPTPQGELDIFVSGNIHSDTGITLGSPNYPASTRLYVGGDEGMTLSGEAEIGGNIYVAPGTLWIEDSMEVFGALFAQEAVFESELYIHYDRQVTRVGLDCPTSEDDDNGDDDNGDDDNGDDDNGDDDNGDDEPVCLLAGDSCETDADCCAPLICDPETYTCSMMACRGLGEPCSYNDECCSEQCGIGAGDDEGQCIGG